MTSLKDRAKKANSNGGIPFMEGRTKGTLVMGEVVDINDFGFITNKKGRYGVISLLGNIEEFFFVGGVICEKLDSMELSPNDIHEIKKDGLPVVFFSKENKEGTQTYLNCEFYPESDGDQPY